MFRDALILCTLAQAFLLGVGSEPSTFSLNDLLASPSAEAENAVDNVVEKGSAEVNSAVEQGKGDFDLQNVIRSGHAHVSKGVSDASAGVQALANSILGSSATGATETGVVQASRRRRTTGDRRRRTRPSFQSEMETTDWDMATRHIVDGMMKEFFAKVSLQQVEKDCLDEKLGEFSGDIAGLVSAAVKALKPILSSKVPLQEQNKDVTMAGMVPLLLQGVSSITDLVTTSTVIAKNCLLQDGLNLLNETGHKLLNFSFIEHQMMVNGVDVAKSLAEGVVAFENEDFTKFGGEIGITLRKILLSTNNKVITLPEGMATERDIEDASKGLAQGFFAPGSVMTIYDKADSDVNFRIDLHQCIVDDHQFFKDTFKGIWELVAQLSVNAAQHQFSKMSIQNISSIKEFFTGPTGSPQWMTELTLAFARVPTLLQRCDLMNSDTQDMLMEAIHTMGSLRFNFDFPDDKVQAEEATEKVAKAIERFEKQDFLGFGQELGKLFREVLLLAFPEEYAVDESGHLIRKLTGLARLNKKIGGPMLAVSGVALLLLFSILAAKRLRATSSGPFTGRTLIQVEDSENDDIDIETLE